MRPRAGAAEPRTRLAPLAAAALALALTGCSSGSFARQQWPVLGPDAQRAGIEAYLGKPVFAEAFSPPRTIGAISAELAPRPGRPHFPLYTPRYAPGAAGGASPVDLPVSIASHARYRLEGCLIAQGPADGSGAQSLCTVGSSDVTAIAMSVSYAPLGAPQAVVDGGGGASLGGLGEGKAFVPSGDARRNILDVWYGPDGRPWAFQWFQYPLNTVDLGL